MLLRGELPQGPQLAVMQQRCEMCHTLEYVSQQRLSAAQWDKTLTTMQTWGSSITDAEKTTLAPYLASTWPKDLADRVSPRVPAPLAALPATR
jgi:mono/diheme cytochrome c family protein